MAWPDSPPSEQITAYEGGLSGDTDWAEDHSGVEHREPVEYLTGATTETGAGILKDGWYSSAELAAWYADQDDGGGSTPSAGGQAVADFLGLGDDDTIVALATTQWPIVQAMVKAYTRDEGFDVTEEPNEELSAVITTATARLVANPEQLPYDSGATSMRGGFNGFSLAETFVLNRYRKRAM